jgi:DNA processing protein
VPGLANGRGAAVVSAPVDTGEPRTDLQYWLALLRAPGLGAAHATRLLAQFGEPRTLFEAGAASWRAAGIPHSLHGGLREPDWAGVEADLRWLAGAGRSLLTWNDPRYPAALREIVLPPVALFCQGDVELLARPQLAIVGARSATPQGLENAHAFAAELTRRGLLVTSGLAQGIDGAAHRGALDAGGATVAVCATGLDRVYPAAHRELAHRIAERGVLVSEFPAGTPPLADHFPRRNRLISGLALGVLVVEAAPQSGSLITARFALEQGREVFAIPGSIHSPVSKGCHRLIRQGAKLTEHADDILEELGALPGLAPAPAAARTDGPVLDEMQRRVLDALGHEATAFDTLVERLSLPVGSLGAALLALELQGCIAAVPGGAWQRLSPNQARANHGT